MTATARWTLTSLPVTLLKCRFPRDVRNLHSQLSDSRRVGDSCLFFTAQYSSNLSCTIRYHRARLSSSIFLCDKFMSAELKVQLFAFEQTQNVRRDENRVSMRTSSIRPVQLKFEICTIFFLLLICWFSEIQFFSCHSTSLARLARCSSCRCWRLHVS